MTTESPVNPPVSEPLPEGLRLGAHDLGDGRASFALYAPWKQAIHLVGDFNDWNTEADALRVSPEGVWWIIKELPAGEHAYQFFIDGELAIADPYSRAIRWGEGEQPHSLLAVGAEPYAWNDDGFAMRPFNEQVIYELHVGDFSPEGTFRAVIDRLPYLQDLGVTALELMPVFEFPGDRSWGYNPAFFFCVESAYGTLDDFRELVDKAHQHGIGIILDVVFNHIDESSPINYLYPYPENPYFSSDSNPWGFPDFNHWSDASKQLLGDAQEFWLNELHIDGFRYDYAPGIGFDGTNGISYLTWQARQIKPHVYLIVENTDDYTSMVLNSEANASWHISFSYQAIANMAEQDFNGCGYGDVEATFGQLDFRGAGYTDNAQAINFLESHDEQRVIYEVTSNPNIHPDTAHLKSKLGAAMLFTAAGVPMLYHGQEFGMWTERTIDDNTIHWELLEHDHGRDLHAFYRGMIQLRHTCSALVSNNIAPLVMDQERKLMAYYRWSDDDSCHVVTLLNFGIEYQHVEVPFPRGGTWHEWAFDYDQDVSGDGPTTIDIPGSGAKVFVLK